ncbi:helix-turn-helix domain-containing protein [Duganella sp. S19_KUP01_CR8]|uniref:helix-turn-helix domain-containing protein n=1 Tax=Duganella sp. S19_KUP01_CR8 TaxID=3025502 RepID=UPI002FCDB71F
MNSEWAEPPKDQGSSLATPGAQLAARREAMGLTVEQIADQLKLAPRQVKALEAGDYAALPNMAVVRGFVRAYAKVVKLDATPLVAMIEVISPTSHEAAPPRKEIAATFTESRFPSMTGRSPGPAAWLVGVAVVVVVAAAGAYAYQAGLIPATLFQRSDKDEAASASAAVEAPKPADVALAPIETTLAKPGQETAPLQSPSVPLISVPPQGAATDAAPAAATPAAAVPAPAPVPAAPIAQVSPPAAAAATANGTQLVLKVTQDSWVEIRRPGTTPLISRLVKAGSTETFDIKDAALLIVGKPTGVEATLGGAPLALPPVAGGTISRVNIK